MKIEQQIPLKYWTTNSNSVRAENSSEIPAGISQNVQHRGFTTPIKHKKDVAIYICNRGIYNHKFQQDFYST